MRYQKFIKQAYSIPNDDKKSSPKLVSIKVTIMVRRIYYTKLGVFNLVQKE